MLRDEAGPPFSLEALKTFAASQLAEENIDFWIEARAGQLTNREFGRQRPSFLLACSTIAECSTNKERRRTTAVCSLVCVPKSRTVFVLPKSAGICCTVRPTQVLLSRREKSSFTVLLSLLTVASSNL